jgi:branched-chain amino acid transport system substrate-binding protein
MEAGIEIYQKQHGKSVAGKTIEVVIRDSGGGDAVQAKRLAQELVVRDKVQVLAGFGFTPEALAVAPIATAAKVPMVVMNAAAGGLTDKSPYMVRTSFSFPSVVPPIAQWAARQGYKKAYVIVADYSPGHDVEAAFIDAFKKTGGEIVGSVRTPMTTAEFAPYLQRVKDARPDVVFAYENGGSVAPALMKEFRESGLPQAGVRLIGTGDITDEASLEAVGDNALGTVTVYPYSMTHKSDLNAAFVRDFKALRGPDARPTIMAVSAYDGMAAIYAALGKNGGNAQGDALLAAMKGLKFESPRGPVEIDAATRDIRETEYIRRVEKVSASYSNEEFASYPPAN